MTQRNGGGQTEGGGKVERLIGGRAGRKDEGDGEGEEVRRQGMVIAEKS